MGIGRVNVPVMTPVTDVHSPDPKRMGWNLDLDVRRVDEHRLEIVAVDIDTTLPAPTAVVARGSAPPSLTPLGEAGARRVQSQSLCCAGSR